MSAASLAERLDALGNGLRETNQLILDLSELDNNRLSKEEFQEERPSLDETRTDLGAEIHANLGLYEDELELLNQDVEDFSPELDTLSGVKAGSRSSEPDLTSNLVTGCRKLAEELKRARSRYHKAQLQAKANAEKAARNERAAYLESLQAFAIASSKDSEDRSSETKDKASTSQSALRTTLFGGRRGPRKDPNATQEDLLLTASSDVTSSLKRTHALITSEVSRSQFAHETLESSNAALAELNERYESFDELLSKTKGVLGTLLRSQKSDTWYLETALRILVITVSLLFFRRICYGLLWWSVWLPLKIIYGILHYVLGGVSLLFRPSSSSKPLTTSASLKIMPSATGKPPKFPDDARGGQGAGYVRAGAGGVGAKRDPLSGSTVLKSPSGSYSESIGTMIEQSTELSTSTTLPQATSASTSGGDSGSQDASDGHDRPGSGEAPDDRDVRRRGDGQPLQDRDEAKDPPNPKKRMWEESSPEQDRKNNERRNEL